MTIQTVTCALCQAVIVPDITEVENSITLYEIIDDHKEQCPESAQRKPDMMWYRFE